MKRSTIIIETFSSFRFDKLQIICYNKAREQKAVLKKWLS